jgi:DNA-binding HxlR family transcriptional regulator
MQSVKIGKVPERRKAIWYDDACGTAFALELLGERWTILILRELMFGPRRFSELKRDLNGISANVLSQRLERMIAEGMAVRLGAPGTARMNRYGLTKWGYEAEPLVQMLGKWATRHPGHNPSLPLSAASIMMSFRTMFAPERAADYTCRLGFRLGGDEFLVVVDRGQISIRRIALHPDEYDALVTAPPTMIAALVYGGVSLTDWLAHAMGTIEGDAQLLARFAALFVLPEKIVLGD